MAKRWQERMIDLENAVKRLDEAINDSLEYKLDSLKDSVIQRFEFTLELCWKGMKIYLNSEGVLGATSPRATIREAFSNSLIEDGQVWMDMLNDRNLTSHTYNQKMADEIYENIVNEYFEEIKKLLEMLKEKEVDEKCLV